MTSCDGGRVAGGTRTTFLLPFFVFLFLPLYFCSLRNLPLEVIHLSAPKAVAYYTTKMETMPWTKSECFAWNDGRRIVDLYELSKQLHCKQCSSLLDLRRTEREARYGLSSILYIHCNCGVLNDVHTGRIQQGGGDQSSQRPMYEINIKASISK